MASIGSRFAPAAAEQKSTELRARSTKVANFVDRNVFVILAVAAAGVVRVSLFGLGIGSDTWYTILGGRIVSRSWLPHADTLTVLGRGREWVDQQWLAHLFLYGTWTAGGWGPTALVLLASFLGAFALAAASARRLGASATSTAIVAVLCFALALAESSFRAQTLAYPLFAAVLLILLVDDVRPSRRVFLTLPLLVVWANVHGSVVLGAALVSLRGLALAWERRAASPRAVALVVLPWLCTIASPYGFALPGYYLRLFHNPALTSFVSEWRPATVTNEPVFYVLLLGSLGLLLRRRSERIFPLLVVLATAAGGLLAIRSIVWFALAAAAVLPRALTDLLPDSAAPRRRRLNLLMGGTALAVLAAAATAYAAQPRSSFERGYPPQAGAAVAQAAASDPHALVFADEKYADWLLVEHPQLAGRIAYDVRFELLGQHRFRRIARFRREQGANWLAVANGYRLFVLDPSGDAGAIEALRRRGARVLHADRDVVVLERAARHA